MDHIIDLVGEIMNILWTIASQGLYTILSPSPNRQRLSFALLPTSFERVLLCLFQNDICISRLIVSVTKRSGSGAGLIRTIIGRARHTQ